jgi:flagellar hook-basal body complex protein FliE
MSPISAIPPSMSGMMPRLDMISPDMKTLPSTGIEMPTELGKAQPVTPGQPSSDSFATMLGRMVSDVNAQQNNAAQTVGALQGGQNVPLHQAVISMEEANVSFQLMVEVRNRLLESYQEIMRMQI